MSSRLLGIDRLRGLVIALMALDHVRDFFSPTPFWPDDLPGTTPGWFFTRWITHLCAPVFVLLAGSSAFVREQKYGKAAQSRYLLTRGLMLVLLEVTVINLSWQFSYSFIFLQVIWALGIGMIVLAGLIWLPRWAIALFAFSQILLHNLLDGLPQPDLGFFWGLLHFQNYYPLHSSGFGVFVAYPIIPWLGVMAAGYLLGEWLLTSVEKRQQKLVVTGLLLLGLFVVLRSFNGYGDHQLWASQPQGAIYTVMSFLDASKYPPSLLYLCVTLGPALLLLALFDKWAPPLDRGLMLFGRHPLFVYVIHIPLIHVASLAFMHVLYGDQPNLFGPQPYFPPGYEYSLLRTWIAWALVLAVLFVMTRWWSQRGQKSNVAG